MTSQSVSAQAAYKSSSKLLPNMNSRSQRFGLFALISFILCGCHRPNEPLSPGQRETIQARVTTRFDNAVLFKPVDSGSNNTVTVRLAPLIIQAVADTNAASLWRDQFAAGDSGPVVTGESGTTVVNGRPHDQVSYSWTYAASEPPAHSVRHRQGLRLTLNASGEPVLWEVLDDSTGADIIYAAQSLELAARAQFGPPLPGRKFSLERGLEEAPRTVVANVISDGPLPMGPVVYLFRGSHDVSALICRCMEAQARELVGQKDYQLMVATNASVRFPSREGIERRLRLPEQF